MSLPLRSMGEEHLEFYQLGNNSSQMSETYHISQLDPGSVPLSSHINLFPTTPPQKRFWYNSLEEEAIIFHSPSRLIKNLKVLQSLFTPQGQTPLKHTQPHTLM